ncbi:chitin synthase export chaperone [Elsinoe ampelina]|uniref:Chitin synthase export chaperone n=1 Tax=Elsinoe ampelina TaxID=302913 RepID=A0A6A6GJA7_9PEZI|nr:chitin synthase export chaperone [Elsinoe ampelina]
MGFGDFDVLCQKAALPLCPLVGPPNAFTGQRGIQPLCYSRSISLANTIIFQGAAAFAHIMALIMTIIMIIHVRSKFTAVGRKEITTFFYLYFLLSAFSLVLDAGVVPLGSAAYPYFVAAQSGLASATAVSLLISGMVGFQLYEDGTKLSVWLLRTGALVMFIVTFAVNIFTFKGIAGLGPTKTIGLFVVLYIATAIFVFVYIVMQFLLVFGTLTERWPAGHLAFCVFFFVAGQVILYVFADSVCEGVQHYMDGLLFATVCNLLAVMMVYKYWDSITREDLEFSVGQRTNNWEVKELMQDNDHTNTDYQDSDYAASMYQPRHRTSVGGSTGY